MSRGAEKVAGERAEHGEVHDADRDFTGGAEIIGHGFGGDEHAAHAENHVLGIFHPIGADAAVAAAGEFEILFHRLFGEGGQVFEEEGALGGDALHVSVLVLHGADHDRVIDGPEFGNATTRIAEENALGGGGSIDNIVRAAQIPADEFALG